ncbi:coiled-coil domain-containing protein 85B [Sceloporus undulatus]|uniref:coiled-coil domain-containing protein 85B n=1 Tax=Sceloporus undulatus TaxID=8520 RepID=UPI001C4BA3FC|nr:coiled-coil domain-containing protein 85B [Sceloporus undulatus]
MFPASEGAPPEPLGSMEETEAAAEAEAEEDLARCSKEELVLRLRREEAQRLSALVQRGKLMQGVNLELQAHLREVRELKALNGRLQAENRELRELCLFLDQERLRDQSLALQWRRFGTGAARQLRLQVGLCLGKIRALEELQGSLARDNRDLQRLCLALREEQADRAPEAEAAPGDRDLGDGSSSTGSLASPDQGHGHGCPEGSPKEDSQEEEEEGGGGEGP